MNLRYVSARAISKTSRWGLKHLFHRPAANMPGKLALYLDPQVIAHARKKLKQGSFVVCGTNGKTTVTNLLADTLEAQGYSVVCNRTGANLDSGVASSLLATSKCDWGVFESDELWLAKILPHLQADYLVLLNLFRDQLDRCGEISYVQDAIAKALTKSPHTTLIYNADDPLCAGIALRVNNPRIAFGIDGALSSAVATATDPQLCQSCQSMLDYHYSQYGQLGDYFCSSCGFAREPLVYAAAKARVGAEGVSFDLVKTPNTEDATKETLGTITSPNSGAYMIYNLLACCTASLLAGCDMTTFQAASKAYQPGNGRLQSFELANRSILLNLAKNPTGFNQNIQLALQDPHPKVLGFFVNDKEGDGRDVSWLWDIDFESLADSPVPITTFAGGMRKEDLAVRLKYAGLTSELYDTAHEILHACEDLPEDTHFYLIANYTALPALRIELEGLHKNEENQGGAHA